MPDTITIPLSIDGIEQAIEDVLSNEELLLNDIREKLLHARIRNEYRILKKKRGWGKADEIRIELAKRFFNSEKRERHIWNILYQKY